MTTPSKSTVIGIARDGEESSCHRYGVCAGKAEQKIGFFLADTFAMLPFISAVEPLRAANRFSGRDLYDWELLGDGTDEVMANNAMKVRVDGSIHDGVKLSRLIVCGPHSPHFYNDAKALRALRQYSARGTLIGSLDTGSYLLAQADLIKRRRCTIHWENIPGFREAFPELMISSELFEVDNGLITCAGGTAAFDMMLAIIRQDHGNDLAEQVADLFIATVMRESSAPQRRGTVERARVYHPGVVNCIELMESNLEQPIGTTDLADMVGVSSRQLERLFRTHLGTTPTLYYQQVRLKAGHDLLRQTSMSVLEIAAAMGFTSADYFSRRFRVQFGYSPTEARKRS
jgi:AraC family carnitine catabolism transcriptional activator